MRKGDETMELHISSNDFEYITDIYELAHERLDDLKGFCSIKGTKKDGQFNFSVYVNKKDITKAMKIPVSFGEMLDIMMNSPCEHRLYFQREDWQGTPKAIFMDSGFGGNYYISMCNGLSVSGGDSIDPETGIYYSFAPYIPTYEDFFDKGWCLYKVHSQKLIDAEDDFGDDEGEMVDYGGFSR